jgi:hypothetical protein
MDSQRMEREQQLEGLSQCPNGHDTRHFYKWLDEIDNLREELKKWEDDETSICPEGMDFVEYIQRLFLLNKDAEDEAKKAIKRAKIAEMKIATIENKYVISFLVGENFDGSIYEDVLISKK